MIEQKNKIEEEKELKSGEMKTVVGAETVNKLLAEVDELKKRDEENQAKLKMLYEVADKGRIFNYENKTTEKKPLKVKLSFFQDGIIVGWRTVKDELIKHPTTGLIVGETQEYELLILDKEDKIKKIRLQGYPAFSNARYDERIECEVISRKEDFIGNINLI